MYSHYKYIEIIFLTVEYCLLFIGIPDSPEALEAVNVSHQAALLSWTPGFDGGLTQTFQLRLRKNQESTMTFVHIPMNLTSYTLSGLSQGTSYEVSIAAKNLLGESQYSAPITFNTKSELYDFYILDTLRYKIVPTTMIVEEIETDINSKNFLTV